MTIILMASHKLSGNISPSHSVLICVLAMTGMVLIMATMRDFIQFIYMIYNNIYCILYICVFGVQGMQDKCAIRIFKFWRRRRKKMIGLWYAIVFARSVRYARIWWRPRLWSWCSAIGNIFLINFSYCLTKASQCHDINPLYMCVCAADKWAAIKMLCKRRRSLLLVLSI